jgi:hypothetical protein
MSITSFYQFNKPLRFGTDLEKGFQSLTNLESLASLSLKKSKKKG